MGHWLEERMGIKHNASNTPDLLGFEMKNQTTSKTTFGDWSADYYIFRSTGNPDGTISRDNFMRIFGSPNPKKNNRYSWSGAPCPKIKSYNAFGQILKVYPDNSIVSQYSYDEDGRKDKNRIVPNPFKKKIW